MSYTELIPFIDGLPQSGIEFRNAWGGSARIWTSLFDAHVPKKHQYDSWLTNADDRRLWDIAIRKDVPMFARAVHAFTFDRFFVRKEHFKAFCDDLISFVKHYPVEGKVDHLPAWAQWLIANPDVEAIGLHGTSVSENQWHRSKTCTLCDHPTDETEPVPITEGTEVYEWIESLTTQTQAEGKG